VVGAARAPRADGARDGARRAARPAPPPTPSHLQLGFRRVLPQGPHDGAQLLGRDRAVAVLVEQGERLLAGAGGVAGCVGACACGWRGGREAGVRARGADGRGRLPPPSPDLELGDLLVGEVGGHGGGGGGGVREVGGESVGGRAAAETSHSPALERLSTRVPFLGVEGGEHGASCGGARRAIASTNALSKSEHPRRAARRPRSLPRRREPPRHNGLPRLHHRRPRGPGGCRGAGLASASAGMPRAAEARAPPPAAAARRRRSNFKTAFQPGVTGQH